MGVLKGEDEVVERVARGCRGGQVSKDVFKVFLGIGDDMNYDLGYGELFIGYLTILCSYCLLPGCRVKTRRAQNGSPLA